MKNALILHGTDADHNEHWFSWLEKELTKLGYTVWVPDLPQADHPNIERYNKFLLGSDFKFNSETIIIGHSSGAVEILGLLNDPNFPKDVKVKACFLVGAFKGDLGWESLKGMKTDFDYELVKQKSSKFIFIHSDNDPYCPIEDTRDLCKQVDGKFIEIPEQGHFNTGFDPKYKEFPELAEIIKNEV
jgi:predicted alpha/beta hydrolase family esterase